MAAKICLNIEKASCRDCKYFQMDSERGCMACFAKPDANGYVYFYPSISKNSNTLVEKVAKIESDFDTIMSYAGLHGDMRLELSEKENPFGGNPDIKVKINCNIDGFKETTVIRYQMASQTENGFFNEVKAYLFDLLEKISRI